MMLPLRISTDLVGDALAARQRMVEEGYLYIPGLLPRDAIAPVQRQAASIACEAGWLCANQPLEATIADPSQFCLDPDTRFLSVLDRINRLYDFQALGHHPNLIGFFEELCEDEILVHPKGLPRFIFPGRVGHTTPAHQDFPNIQGSEAVYTAWIPLIDCTADSGGLQIAAGSHTLGVLDFDLANGVGGIEIKDRLEGRWVGGPMRAGDVLIFHSMVVHKGIPNTGRKLRMSVDIRYQGVSQPFCVRNADKPYGRPETWAAMYENWSKEQRCRLAYYWQRQNLTCAPFDSQWFDRRDALGFAYGEKGDPRARSVLLRVAARDANPEKRSRAQNLLDRLDGLSAGCA
jgi:hypothetical protein